MTAICAGHEMDMMNAELFFETRQPVADMRPCMKRQIVVHAKKMDQPFRVKSMEGDYKQGKPGDYLMRGVEGELYICDGHIFEKTYDMHDADRVIREFSQLLGKPAMKDEE